MVVPATFLLAKYEPGDLLFYYKSIEKQQNEENFVNNDDVVSGIREATTAVSTVGSAIFKNIFHVAMVISRDNDEVLIHATDEGVIIQSFIDSIMSLKPEFVELCHVVLDDSWKERAVKWSLEQHGCKYNDLYSSECLNSKGEKAFYCSQLAVESYSATNLEVKNCSPFLSHSLNFLDKKGKLLNYWIEYYRKLCPNDPKPPQGRPGSHPSKLRASPVVCFCAKRYFYEFNTNYLERMMRFNIPNDLVSALHFVNGTRLNIGLGKSFDIIEPRSGNLLSTCKAVSEKEVSDVVSCAVDAQKKWSQMPWLERRQILNTTANLLRKHINELSEWEVRDNGKPIYEAKMDILSCADTFDFFSGINLSGEHIPYNDEAGRFAYTRREPYGVVGAIGAWNYPIQTATWKIAPAIACGNSIIYKPSPLAPISSILLALVLQCAGLPDGIVNIVQGEANTGVAICKCPLVKKVSFTGSLITGKLVATSCAHLNIKPVTLELGGKSACIVFDDADIDMAVTGVMLGNFLTQGQVCSNASKVLVHRNIIDEFTKRLLNRTEKLRIGDPLNEKTHIGALISLAHLFKVQQFIKTALEEGASIVTGGERINISGLENGFFMSPCILTNINSKMRVYREEIFGPVMLIIPFENEEEALRIANDTEFGLAGGLFTSNLRRAHEFGTKINAGNIYINTYNDVHPNVPFGGFNQSGYGRENGEAAISDYTQIKSIFLNISGKLDNPFI